MLLRGISANLKSVLSISKYTPTYKSSSFQRISQRCEMEKSNSRNIVWMDMEMTGLDISKDKILEISCIITDSNLNLVTDGKTLVIKRSREVLDNMNEWCIEHHNKSGLVQKCLESDIDIVRAEEILLDYLKNNIPERECPLAGNSVYMDRLFLRTELPKVDAYLHYRIIDVSSIKELARRWNPNVFKAAPEKRFAHRTLDDIEDSINELKYYRQSFLKLE